MNITALRLPQPSVKALHSIWKDRSTKTVSPPVDHPRTLQALLKFGVKGGDKRFVYASKPSAMASKFSGSLACHAVMITDGRPARDTFSLDKEGFELRAHTSKVPNFYKNESVQNIYYPEVEDLVKTATGATRVTIFDHTLRSEKHVQKSGTDVRSPVHVAHNDYTVLSGRQRVFDLIDEHEVEEYLSHRYAIINVWRSIGRPVETGHLALADSTSIDPEDFLATDLVYPDRVGEIYHIAHNPNQRWFYFPRMSRDEALLIKTFDSATDGRARFNAHTAFDDPEATNKTPPRESVEVRALVSFKS